MLGDSLKLGGNREGAIEHFERYLELASENAIDRDNVEEQLREMGVRP
jgi:CRISPR/Cas system CSM-associated protein Csm3 (group 7 of RAMP superfamily)